MPACLGAEHRAFPVTTSAYAGVGPRRAVDGSWPFGYSFKLPYRLFRLLRRLDGPALRDASLARAATLSIPFE